MYHGSWASKLIRSVSGVVTSGEERGRRRGKARTRTMISSVPTIGYLVDMALTVTDVLRKDRLISSMCRLVLITKAMRSKKEMKKLSDSVLKVSTESALYVNQLALLVFVARSSLPPSSLPPPLQQYNMMMCSVIHAA